MEESYIDSQIITPSEYIGAIMKLAMGRRGNYINTTYIDKNRVDLNYHFPLAEIVFDFYDKLKSISQGFASYSYKFLDYQPAEVVKLDILVAGDIVDQLSTIVYRDGAYVIGRQIVKSLKKILPRQLFEVKLQAAIGGKILASERIPPMRKDVTAKLYGGDVTRKKKLLAKQKKGKKKLMKLGKVNIPSEAYWAVMKR